MITSITTFPVASLSSLDPRSEDSSVHIPSSLETLESYVLDNDVDAIRALFDDRDGVEELENDLRACSYAPLHHAALQGNFHAFKVMAEKLPIEALFCEMKDTTCTLFMFAAGRGRVDVLDAIRQAVWEKSQAELEPANKDLIFRLMSFIFDFEAQNRASVWKNFNLRWAMLNATDRNDQTPLSLALNNQHEDCVRFLLGEPTQMSLRDQQYEEKNTIRTPCLVEKLENYVLDGDIEAIRVLLDCQESAGILMGELRACNYAPLHHAALQGNFHAFKVMADRMPFEALFCKMQDAENTLFMFAVKHGRVDILETLRQAVWEKSYAEVEPEEKSWLSMLLSIMVDITGHYRMVASKNFYQRWEWMLNAADHNDQTPLSVALKNKHEDCVRFLFGERVGDFGRKVGDNSFGKRASDTSMRDIATPTGYASDDVIIDMSAFDIDAPAKASSVTQKTNNTLLSTPAIPRDQPSAYNGWYGALV